MTGAESTLYELLTSGEFSAATSILLLAAAVIVVALWRRLSALVDLTVKREGETLMVLKATAEDAKDRDTRTEAEVRRLADAVLRLEGKP